MAVVADRIPFQEAVESPLLLADRWAELSEPQKVVLLSLYGCDLTPDQQVIFAALQGFAEYDDLGFIKRVLPGYPAYQAKEFREGWFVIGRRGGKSDRLASTIVAYEAACGGHEGFLARGQTGICFQIAQDLRMARYSLNFIRSALEGSKLLSKLITNVTADRIDLRNSITIYSVPATLKSVRGFASPVSVLDEVGVWWQDADAANPDYEIYRALGPGQLQFPHRKTVGISTPWNKAGLLWKFADAGTNGQKLAARTGGTAPEEFADVLVCHAPTAAIGNPLITREFLLAERQRDIRAFERECLAVFQDSISGFLPPAFVERARQPGIFGLSPDPEKRYVAAMDPAFKRDAFALTVVHSEDGKIVQDVLYRWTGSVKEPLNPREVLSEISRILSPFGISVVHTDQYHLESLAQLALEFGLSLWGTNFTAKSKAEMYGNLQQLFAQDRLRILDNHELLRELKSLERTLSQGGSVQISAPSGMHDDLATVLVLAVSQAMWEGAETASDAPPPPPADPYRARIEENLRTRYVQPVDEWWG